MRILAIDASTNVASVALLSGERLLCEATVNYKLKHSKILMEKVETVMKDAGLTYREVDYLAVTKGPGSFTGIRIGLATAKGIAQGAGKKIIPVSTIEALAYNMKYADGIICPVLDARRSQVYTGLFRSEPDGRITRILEDRAMDPAELKALLDGHQAPVYLLGDGVGPYGETLRDGRLSRVIVAPFKRLNSAASLAAAAMARMDEAQDLMQVEPSYLRASYAEEKHV